MVLLIFMVLFLISSASSIHVFRDYNRGIHDGSTAQPGQFPFAAYLMIPSNGIFHLCTGALLSDEWVITAAHCGKQSQSFHVKLGSQNPTLEHESERITDTKAKVINHPAYNSTDTHYDATNDIALVKLSKKIKFTNRIKPALLPKANKDLYVGREVIASGWGRNNKNTNDLQWTTLRIISNEECARAYQAPYIAETTMCAKGKAHENTCPGDSGGPLLLKSDSRTLVGITRYGLADGCHKGTPGGYARVNHYLPWIKQVTGITPN